MLLRFLIPLPWQQTRHLTPSGRHLLFAAARSQLFIPLANQAAARCFRCLFQSLPQVADKKTPDYLKHLKWVNQRERAAPPQPRSAKVTECLFQPGAVSSLFSPN